MQNTCFAVKDTGTAGLLLDSHGGQSKKDTQINPLTETAQ